jgi:hypothetical protein
LAVVIAWPLHQVVVCKGARTALNETPINGFF